MYTGSIPVLASKTQAIDMAHISERDAEMRGLSTDFQGTPMLIKDAIRL